MHDYKTSVCIDPSSQSTSDSVLFQPYHILLQKPRDSEPEEQTEHLCTKLIKAALYAAITLERKQAHITIPDLSKANLP